MKKYFLMMLSAILFMACSNDDENKSAVIDFEDYAQTVGMSYSNMIKTYGEPSMNFGSYYLYEITGKNTQSITVVINPANSTVYSVMQMLGENAYKAEDIKAYFAKNYTLVSNQKDEASGEDYTTFCNAKSEDQATLVITVSGNESVTYTNPQNEPSEPDGPSLDDMKPEDAVSTFLGMDEEDFIDQYGDYTFSAEKGKYMILMETDMLMGIGITVDNGKVTEVTLLYNEDLTDEDIIAYYEKLGFIASDCGEDEETGAHVYLFMNLTTKEMFRYSDGIGHFVYVDENGYDDEEDDDED